MKKMSKVFHEFKIALAYTLQLSIFNELNKPLVLVHRITFVLINYRLKKN